MPVVGCGSGEESTNQTYDGCEQRVNEMFLFFQQEKPSPWLPGELCQCGGSMCLSPVT